MSETPDEPEDDLSGQPQLDEVGRPRFRKVSEDELKEVLEAHKRWVQSNGKEGEKADLNNADLTDADLQGAGLYRANLQGASLDRNNLRGANLARADLSGAGLRHAEFQNANLYGANLRKAILRAAKLQGTRLHRADLRRADLRRTKLHKANLQGANLEGADLSDVKGLQEANLRDINLESVTGLVGTEFARTDVTGARLPKKIAQFEGLGHVEETSKNARKTFFAMLLGCAYSWLTIATTTDAQLLNNSAAAPLPIIQTEIPIAGFYWAAPLILLSFYFYFHLYLQRLWQGLADLPAVFPDGKPVDQKVYPWLLNGIVRAHFARLRDDRPPVSRLENFISIVLAWWVVPLTLGLFWLRYFPRHDWWTILHIAVLVVATWSGMNFYWLAKATLRGEIQQPGEGEPDEEPDEKEPSKREAFIIAVRRNGRTAGVSLVAAALVSFLTWAGIVFGLPERVIPSETACAERPTKNYCGKDYRTWVPRGFALIGVSVFADLFEANVSTKPENWRGKEEDVPLVKGASLQKSDLRYADAEKAFLVKADLREANLQGAKLLLADLQGANLLKANLKGADLRGAKLQGAILWRAKLRGADLRDAKLQEANLGDAKLQGADLSYASGLTQKQLDEACGDAKTKLPDYLKDYKIKPCPKESL